MVNRPDTLRQSVTKPTRHSGSNRDGFSSAEHSADDFVNPGIFGLLTADQIAEDNGVLELQQPFKLVLKPGIGARIVVLQEAHQQLIKLAHAATATPGQGPKVGAIVGARCGSFRHAYPSDGAWP